MLICKNKRLAFVLVISFSFYKTEIHAYEIAWLIVPIVSAVGAGVIGAAFVLPIILQEEQQEQEQELQAFMENNPALMLNLEEIALVMGGGEREIGALVFIGAMGSIAASSLFFSCFAGYRLGCFMYRNIP